MTFSITSVDSSAPVQADAGVALQAKHAQCLRQLGDWEACPSSKTPEGKKIIDNLRIQVQRIEAQMGTSATSQGPASQPSTSSTSVDTLGGMINLFA